MYFKITNQDECHHGYQYKTGLNILDKPFESKGSCVSGGLYFTTLVHLHHFYDYGIWLREVTIPEDARMVMDPSANKWRANKIILGDKYPLFDDQTIKKFNLRITECYVDNASRYGSKYDNLEILKLCGSSATKDAIDEASLNGHTHLLEWWKNSGLQLMYTTKAIDMASHNGHVKALEWWRSFELQSDAADALVKDALLKYSCDAIDWASMNGQVDVLEWWLKAKNEFGWEFLYSNYAMNLASESGHVKVLEWWMKAKNESGLTLKYSNYAVDWASSQGHVGVLEWWKNSGLELVYTNSAMDCASHNGHLKVLEWWKNSGLELRYYSHDLELVMNYYVNGSQLPVTVKHDYGQIREWWKNLKAEMEASK